MLRQEIFDKVAAHLIAQGHRAYADGRCVYRAPNGDKCAIGCLIPDDLYTSEMEGAGVDAIYDRDAFPEAVAAFFATLERLGIDEADGLTHDLLSSLQSAHDYIPSWPDPRPALHYVAGKFGLEARF